MKVTIKDFQALKGENVFEFPVGITIIQGKTDSGKTTVFYAIEDCLSNPSGVADVINWDADKAEVTIENNGGYVKWIKTASSSEYIDKDGKPYVKASKLDSRNIDDLGFYFNKKGDIINIHDEWAKLFPFESSDVEMFKLFEDIFNISSSFQVIDAIKKDEQDVKQRTDQILSNINERTIQNNNIETILNNIDSSKIDYYNNQLNTLNDDVNVLKNVYADYVNNEKYCSLFIPESFDINNLQLSHTNYSNLYNDYMLYLNNCNYIELPENKTFNLIDNPYLADYNEYIKNLGIIEASIKTIDNLNHEYSELEDRKLKIKVCPTCGRPLE